MSFSNIPFDQIIKFGQRTMLEDSVFSVSWILGRFCNYQCSYCWPYARTNKPDYESFDVYTNTVREIKRQAHYNGFDKFHWSLSGGEPTAYNKLIQLIEVITDHNQYQSFHMTTNLSPGVEFWKKWINATSKFNRRSITASFHSEFADEHEFGDKILMLMDSGIFVNINQVMVPSQFYSLFERCQRFIQRGINVTLKPQSDPTASFVVTGYTEDMINIMREGFPQRTPDTDLYHIAMYDKTGNRYLFDQAERFNAFGFNRFSGWNCNSGYQSIIIRGNEVKRSYSCHDTPLGTLSDGFKLFTTPTICTTNSCVSSADSKIPKCIDTKI